MTTSQRPDEAGIGKDPKARDDSELRALTEERQAEIADYAGDHTLAQTIEWLRGQGVATSSSALSIFLSQYHLGQQLRRNSCAVELLIADHLKKDPSLTPERVQEIGQSFFSGMAIERGDLRFWMQTQQIELKKSKLELELKKFQDHVEARKAAIEHQIAAAKNSGGVTQETLDQIERDLKLM